ncbi:MAG: tyrosine--tRNA ligase [Kiloniellales bacterium]
MTEPRSEFMRTVTGRGFVHQCTDIPGLDALAAERAITAYIGFDLTAPSLHVGSLVSIMLLRHLQRAGHRPIVLIGGGTSKVGDPSGRDRSRRLMTAADIAANMASIKSVFDKFLRFGDAPDGALMVDNAEWLDRLGHVAFLRDVGRHFTVNRMIAMDAVRQRLDSQQPLSLLEFNYMALQAYDFRELNRRHGCVLQMGGSDQWGNIVAGVELARRMDGVQLYGLTTPLITTASGAKMGKTAAGAVWLNAELVSPYDYYQYWRNTHDADVGRFLRLFTELPLDEVARLEALEGAALNEAKRTLAFEATRLCHGKPAAEQAAETARRTFDEGAAAAGLPTLELARAELESGVAAFELMRRAGLAASNGEARRLIRQGGGRINDRAVGDETRTVTLADLNAKGLIKLSAGKKRHALVRAV